MTINFDSILDATTGNTGNRVISEQHDVNQIKFDASDKAISQGIARNTPGLPPVWDAYEYGMTREEAQARIDAASTPEAKTKVLAELKARAIARASLAMTNGRIHLAVAGEAPWHGLGVNVENTMIAQEAMRLAGLAGWEIQKLESFIDFNGERILSGDYSIVRTDCAPPVVFGTVGSRYEIIPNEEVFDFMDKLADQVRFETAGALDNGATVFMLSDIPGNAFDATPGDECRTKLICTSAHDGSGAIQFHATTERAVCKNTHRLAINRGRRVGSIKHTKSARERMQLATAALNETFAKQSEFKAQAQRMAQTEMAQPVPYFQACLDKVLDSTVAGVKCTAENLGTGKVLDAIVELDTEGQRLEAEAQLARHNKRRGKLVDQILDCYESPTCEGSTQWSAYNAVTQTVDHGDMLRFKGDSRKRAESRFGSLVDGRGAEIKDRALELIPAYAN